MGALTVIPRTLILDIAAFKVVLTSDALTLIDMVVPAAGTVNCVNGIGRVKVNNTTESVVVAALEIVIDVASRTATTLVLAGILAPAIVYPAAMPDVEDIPVIVTLDSVVLPVIFMVGTSVP
jgi:hypothetical protein